MFRWSNKNEKSENTGIKRIFAKKGKPENSRTGRTVEQSGGRKRLLIFRKLAQRMQDRKNRPARPHPKLDRLVMILNRWSLLFHMLLACGVCFVIEWVSRHSFIEACQFMVDRNLVFLYNSLIVYATLMLVYIVKRRMAARVFISCFWLFLGVINGCVLAKRVSPFSFTDLKMVGDLFTMQSNYFSNTEALMVIIGVGLVCIGLVILWIKGPKFQGRTHRLAGVFLVAVMALLIPGVTDAAVSSNVLTSYFENLAQGYKDYGFVYSFSSSVLDRGMSEPEDYSEEAVLAVLDQVGVEADTEESLAGEDFGANPGGDSQEQADEASGGDSQEQADEASGGDSQEQADEASGGDSQEQADEALEANLQTQAGADADSMDASGDPDAEDSDFDNTENEDGRASERSASLVSHTAVITRASGQEEDDASGSAVEQAAGSAVEQAAGSAAEQAAGSAAEQASGSTADASQQEADPTPGSTAKQASGSTADASQQEADPTSGSAVEQASGSTAEQAAEGAADASQQEADSVDASAEESETESSSAADTSDWEHPNIICVLLESFVDPGQINFLETDEDPIPNFHYLYENFSSGYVEVPVVGAGTANTEFEVLTGMGMQFFGLGEYPYKTILEETNCESIASDLATLGYGTHVVHDNGANFYSRRNAFSMMGFDTFTSKEMMDIHDYTPLGTWPQDDIMLEYIESALDYTPDSPDFCYVITVESHGDYPKYQVLEDPDIQVSGVEDEEMAWAWEYYVNQVHEVDDFIGELIKLLEERGEPTFVYMFGDHLPTMDLTEEDMATGSLFETQYVTWNNLGMEKTDQNMTSYQLTADMLDLLDIHVGTMFQFQQERGVYDSEDEYQDSMELLQYDILYGDHYVYGGENPYPASDLVMGTRDVVINSVYATEKYLFVTGDQFTKWSKVYVNGKKVKTQYISSGMLRISISKLEEGENQIVVNQVGSSETILRSSNEVYYVKEAGEDG